VVALTRSLMMSTPPSGVMMLSSKLSDSSYSIATLTLLYAPEGKEAISKDAGVLSGTKKKQKQPGRYLGGAQERSI
jgi:hypothetical protein